MPPETFVEKKIKLLLNTFVLDKKEEEGSFCLRANDEWGKKWIEVQEDFVSWEKVKIWASVNRQV